MMPLMPSPGSPKTISTPQSMRDSTRMSAAVSAMAGAPEPEDLIALGLKAALASWFHANGAPKRADAAANGCGVSMG